MQSWQINSTKTKLKMRTLIFGRNHLKLFNNAPVLVAKKRVVYIGMHFSCTYILAFNNYCIQMMLRCNDNDVYFNFFYKIKMCNFVKTYRFRFSISALLFLWFSFCFWITVTGIKKIGSRGGNWQRNIFSFTIIGINIKFIVT